MVYNNCYSLYLIYNRTIMNVLLNALFTIELSEAV